MTGQAARITGRAIANPSPSDRKGADRGVLGGRFGSAIDWRWLASAKGVDWRVFLRWLAEGDLLMQKDINFGCVSRTLAGMAVRKRKE